MVDTALLFYLFFFSIFCKILRNPKEMRLNAQTVPHFKAELTANAGGINLDSVVDSIGGALGNSGQRVTDVEEFHTQIRHVLGHRPEIVHEETKAVVRPASGHDSRPEIEIVSNDVKRGIFSNGVDGLLGNPLEIFRRTNARIDDDLADLLGADTNSSTTTNVVNIFTFNIWSTVATSPPILSQRSANCLKLEPQMSSNSFKAGL